MTERILAPIDPAALYLAKLIVSLFSMLAVEAVLLPVFLALFNVQVNLPHLLGTCRARDDARERHVKGHSSQRDERTASNLG